jgi:hypothetical protein
VIRFSAGLVVVALGVLIGGVATSKLSLVYVSIAISVLALVAWAVGVFLKRGELREELFGGRSELVPAGAGVAAGLSAPGRSASAPASPASPATAVPSEGQDRPGFGQGGFNAGAFSSPAQVRPTWTPREAETAPDQDRATASVGGWGSTTTPPFGTPPVAPRAWEGAKDAKQPPAAPSVPVGDGAPSAGAGSADALRSWFDRPAAKPQPPAGPPGTRRTDKGAPKPADSVATPDVAAADEPPAPADAAPVEKDKDTTSVSGDGASGNVDTPADADDDWPTRYSWLDEEEADEAVKSDDVPLESDDAVAAEVEASDLPQPTSVGASTSAPAKAAPAKAAPVKADAEEVAAERADAEKAEAAETAASPVVRPAFEGTDAADDAPVLPSAEDEPPAKPDSAKDTATADTATTDTATTDTGAKMVTVVPGVPRYHEPDCILIRFMPEADVQTKSIPEAKAAKCTPCVACQPED